MVLAVIVVMNLTRTENELSLKPGSAVKTATSVAFHCASVQEHTQDTTQPLCLSSLPQPGPSLTHCFDFSSALLRRSLCALSCSACTQRGPKALACSAALRISAHCQRSPAAAPAISNAALPFSPLCTHLAPSPARLSELILLGTPEVHARALTRCTPGHSQGAL